MSENMEVKGRCLCGKVSYALSGNLGIFQYCHCSRCRKFTGSPFAANIIVTPQQFRWIDGEELVGRYEVADAKHFATCFCKVCGSSMPWKSKSGRGVVVPAGTLDDDPGLRPTQNIFVGSGANWYVNPDTLPKNDGLPNKG
jgi:hypothetical protein